MRKLTSLYLLGFCVAYRVRVNPAFIYHSYVNCASQTIAVFCHGGFGATWMAHLLDIPLAHAWSGFYLAPSSVTTILMDERSTTKAVPRAIGVSDLSHLYAADLTTQVSKYEKPNRFGSQARPSGIKANYF